MQHSIQTKAMAMQHLLSTLANRSHRPCQSLRALSTSVTTLLSPLTTPHVTKYSPRYSTLIDNTEVPSVPLTQVTTLPNGLRVATESNFSSNEATVGVWIDAGSGIESLRTSGTGFFLKRMVVKGTERRTERQLEEEMENMGGHFRAYTTRDYTYYYANVMDKDVPQALDIFSEMLQNPKLKRSKIESERHEILRFMKELEEEITEEAINDHLHATAFPDSPLGRTVHGPAENVKTITKKDLQKYMSSHYTTPRMVIAATGAVKHEEILEHVKAMFTKLGEGSTKTSELAAKDKTIFTPSEFRIYDEDVPLAHFTVAFNGPSSTDPDIIALAVIQTMIGYYSKSSGSAEHTSSVLVDRLGISKIADEVTTFIDHYSDTGLFGIYARAKLLCDRGRISYAERCAKIDAVDANTIKRVANRFIFDKDIAMVAIGPVQNLPNYDWFRRRTYWNKN